MIIWLIRPSLLVEESGCRGIEGRRGWLGVRRVVALDAEVADNAYSRQRVLPHFQQIIEAYILTSCTRHNSHYFTAPRPSYWHSTAETMCDHPLETWIGNLHALHCDEKNNIVHILKRHHNNASENHLLGLHFTPNFQKERIDPLRDIQPLLQTLGHVRQVLQSDAAEPIARPWSVYECLSGVLVHVPIPFI